MILINELYPIGSILKTHGLRGEIVVQLDVDNIVYVTEELRHVVLRVDGIFVPFRIASRRSRGTGALLLTLGGVDSADDAAEYVGSEVYALRRELPDSDDKDCADGLYAEDLRDFTLTLPDGVPVGSIAHVDTSTANTLLHVDTPQGKNILIPLADDWICAIDPDARTIAMDIPPALLDEL